MLIEASSPVSPEALQLMREEVMASLRCALPAVVLSWNEGKQMITARPIGRNRVSANGKTMTFPILKEVPVFFPVIKMKEKLYPRSCPEECPCNSGGNDCICKHKIRLDIQPGDLCLIIFCDVNTDGWEGGGTGSGATRHHDLADGFALVGFHTQGRLE